SPYTTLFRSPRSPSRPEELAPRRAAIQRLRSLLNDIGASDAVRQRLLTLWLGRDLLTDAEQVPVAGTPLRQELRTISKALVEEMDEDTWQSFPFWDRLHAWAVSQDDPSSLHDVLATRWEETNAVPLELDEQSGDLRCVHPLL